MHRKRAHNIEGTSKSHLAAKAIAAKRATEAAAPTVAPIIETKTDSLPVTHTCPECGVGVETPQLLGRHRKLEHGVQSVVELKRQARLNMTDGLPCPHCDFVAVNKAGYSLHVNNKHAGQTKSEGVTLEQSTQVTRAIVRTNGSAQPTAHNGEAHPDGISEATLALALGRFQGLCTSMATEFDLPPRRFTRELTRLIYATQVR
jgi:uncharacterized C2H2 Zn-finger protein